MPLTEYFADPSTPAPESPVGRLMQQLVSKRPEMYERDFDAARVEANRLILVATARKNFSVPSVVMVQQEAENAAKAKGYWASLRPSAPVEESGA
jgi:hypothetical protein